jgi:hypothetical protein
VDGRDKPGHDGVVALDTIKNIILVSQRPLHEGRLPEASWRWERMRRPRVWLYASRHSGDLGTPSPATRSGCQELAEGLRLQGVSFPRAECPKRGPGVSTNAAAERAFSVPPATVERREAWALIARRPPRLASVASAASRTRRHWMRLAALHVPSLFEGRIGTPRGAFTRENADGCLKIGSEKTLRNLHARHGRA